MLHFLNNIICTKNISFKQLYLKHVGNLSYVYNNCLFSVVKSRAKKTNDGPASVAHRPLRGRNIFLHLLGCRGADKFEENLRLLGAVSVSLFCGFSN